LAPGPPPLAPFGLVLHHDGSWTHEGHAVTHPRLRAAFDRSVRWLPEEGKYIVQLGHFRGQIDVEEAGFFVRQVDLDSGRVRLSDRSSDRLDPGSLRVSPRDGALVCTVKRDLHPAGLAARFLHAAQAELLQAVEDGPEGLGLRVAGSLEPLPALESPRGLGGLPDPKETR
jgi:hypothetical protein